MSSKYVITALYYILFIQTPMYSVVEADYHEEVCVKSNHSQSHLREQGGECVIISIEINCT